MVASVLGLQCGVVSDVVTVYVTWWFLTFFDNFFSVSAPLLEATTNLNRPND